VVFIIPAACCYGYLAIYPIYYYCILTFRLKHKEMKELQAQEWAYLLGAKQRCNTATDKDQNTTASSSNWWSRLAGEQLVVATHVRSDGEREEGEE